MRAGAVAGGGLLAKLNRLPPVGYAEALMWNAVGRASGGAEPTSERPGDEGVADAIRRAVKRTIRPRRSGAS